MQARNSFIPPENVKKFLYPLKTLENLWFSDISGGIEIKYYVEKGLYLIKIIHTTKKSSLVFSEIDQANFPYHSHARISELVSEYIFFIS